MYYDMTLSGGLQKLEAFTREALGYCTEELKRWTDNGKVSAALLATAVVKDVPEMKEFKAADQEFREARLGERRAENKYLESGAPEDEATWSAVRERRERATVAVATAARAAATALREAEKKATVLVEETASVLCEAQEAAEKMAKEATELAEYWGKFVTAVAEKKKAVEAAEAVLERKEKLEVAMRWVRGCSF